MKEIPCRGSSTLRFHRYAHQTEIKVSAIKCLWDALVNVLACWLFCVTTWEVMFLLFSEFNLGISGYSPKPRVHTALLSCLFGKLPTFGKVLESF